MDCYISGLFFLISTKVGELTNNLLKKLAVIFLILGF